MDNPLQSLIDKAAEKIAEKKIEDSQQKEVDPDGAEEEKIEDPKMKKKFKESKDKAKEAKKAAVEDAKKAGSEFLEGVKSDLKDLGVNLGLMTMGSAQFAARIAMVPPAIISVTSMGPGVSSQMIPPMLQSLKAEGDSLSKVYDDCDSKISKLGLRTIAALIPEVAAILTTADLVMGTSKVLIAAVGSTCGGVSGSMPDVQPPIDISNSATDCTNFSYRVPSEGITAENCSSFSAITGTEVSCSNCKRFNKRI